MALSLQHGLSINLVKQGLGVLTIGWVTACLGAKIGSKNREQKWEQNLGAKIGSKNQSRVGSINGNDMEGREQKKVEQGVEIVQKWKVGSKKRSRERSRNGTDMEGREQKWEQEREQNHKLE